MAKYGSKSAESAGTAFSPNDKLFSGLANGYVGLAEDHAPMDDFIFCPPNFFDDRLLQTRNDRAFVSVTVQWLYSFYNEPTPH